MDIYEKIGHLIITIPISQPSDSHTADVLSSFGLLLMMML